MAVARIALGSNLGDRAANLARALELLGKVPGIAVTARSSDYDNPAVGGPADSPPFLNAAASLLTELSPAELLKAMHAVEAAMGRQRRQRWEPRVIDLDLLLYDDEIFTGPELAVPHPLMDRRIFVLIPLAEIAGNATHPVLGLTVKELLERCRQTNGQMI